VGLFVVVFLATLSHPSLFSDFADQAALVAFYKGLTSAGFLRWQTDFGLCGAAGVTCANGKVTQL
jgi:hypothetical protein